MCTCVHTQIYMHTMTFMCTRVVMCIHATCAHHLITHVHITHLLQGRAHYIDAETHKHVTCTSTHICTHVCDACTALTHLYVCTTYTRAYTDTQEVEIRTADPHLAVEAKTMGVRELGAKASQGQHGWPGSGGGERRPQAWRSLLPQHAF
jgi:hypothetical protein